MKIFQIIALLILFQPSFKAFSVEVEIIELYDNVVDESLLKNLNDTTLNNSKNDGIIENLDQESINLTNSNLINDNDILYLPDLWESTDKEDLKFLLTNINNIASTILKKELLSILDTNSIPPSNFNKKEFDNLIIKSLLKFGDRKKAYEIIKSFIELRGGDYDLFYKEFELNYLLSTYNLTEACDYNNEFKKLKIGEKNNFFLKVDIFCLLVQEKFEEANLLNTLLEETSTDNNEYFQLLFEKIKSNQKNIQENINLSINEKEIFLYIAMHRVGNIPLNQKFLEIDPVNLAMPIILSKSTNINLRLKAAHSAYVNNILDNESLSALYQMVDFSSDELENPINIKSKIDKNIEIGMAYYYQLINIQILPISRLEAIISFINFAEKNNLGSIAYELSAKGLDTIEPSNELSEYGPQLVKVYVNIGEFNKAKKWLIFSQNSNSLKEDDSLKSSTLLYNLFNINDSVEFSGILIENLKNLQFNSINESNPSEKNEILFTVFSIIDNKNPNPFRLTKKLQDSKLLPSAYLIDNIRNCIQTNNNSELLLNIIASLDNINWKIIHPEHLRLILVGLKNYNEGSIFNSVLIEILKENNII